MAIENGIGLSFKILFLYNTQHNKWIVSPFKMVSETQNVNCSSFKISASTNDINRQYNTWKYSLENIKESTGLLNIKFFDKKFKKLHNLFNPYQSNELLLNAKKIVNKKVLGSGKKKSVKKKSIKKKSIKKKSIKKKSENL